MEALAELSGESGAWSGERDVKAANKDPRWSRYSVLSTAYRVLEKPILTFVETSAGMFHTRCGQPILKSTMY